MLTNSFIKIKSLNEGLFCTGDIETVGYFMEVCSQFLNKKPLDFFLSGCWEIQLACRCMERELEKFLIELEKIFFYYLVFFQINQNFQKIYLTQSYCSKNI